MHWTPLWYMHEAVGKYVGVLRPVNQCGYIKVMGL